jgi:glycine C-acetyltransferase
MNSQYLSHLRDILDGIETAGLTKRERLIGSLQGAEIVLPGGRRVLNLCANNYLGLAGDPDIVAAAHAALDRWGYGMASVRFICGTQSIHRELEERIAAFVGAEDAILYSSCFDANGGLFETLLGAEDAAISDELNHASIIDGIRLCKARRLRYRNADPADLEARLVEAQDARFRLVATDGVFSMEGTLAPLDRICDLAAAHDALVMVDDSHAVGFVGPTGRGTPERFGCRDRVDIVTGTLGKALGGASGGYTAGRREIVDLLRQRSRPYLFSNTLAPAIAATTLAILDRLERSTALRDRLEANTRHYRAALAAAGFAIPAGDHPIVPILIGDARKAQTMAARMLEEGVYVVAFSYPVVPEGKARIRTQVSAAHTTEQLDRAVAAFAAL